MRNISTYIRESIEMVTEKFITLFYDKVKDKDIMMKYSHEVYDMIVKSYAYIGGLAGCDSYEDFVKEYVDNSDDDNCIWKLVRRGDHLTAVKIYSTKRGGRKGTVLASDCTDQGKKDVAMILKEDYKLQERGAWDEVSGKALGMALNNGAIPFPNTLITELLTDKDPSMFRMRDDGYFYDRKIAGKWHTKLLIGYPPKGSAEERPNADLVKKLKELGKKYEAETKED